MPPQKNKSQEETLNPTPIESTNPSSTVSEDMTTALSRPKKTVLEKIEHAIAYLSGQILERHQIIRLLLLAVASQEHILLIGPPGTGKSLISKKLRNVLDVNQDIEYFERLLTKFSVPEEMFGPLSLKALENDEYIRKFEGYLPSAKIAFVDEIFKANSAILNSLLTILNERLFDQANQRIQVPLISMVAASNELPEISVDSDTDSSISKHLNRNLSALFDRFIFRDYLNYVSLQHFDDLIDFNPSQVHILADDRLNLNDLKWIQSHVKDVKINNQVIDLLIELRKDLRDRGIAVSDRRWLKILNVLKIAALCENQEIEQQSSSVQIWHLQILPWMLWEKENQIEDIQKLIQSKLDEEFIVFNKFDISEEIDLLQVKITEKKNFYLNKSSDDLRLALKSEIERNDVKILQETIHFLQEKLSPHFESSQSLGHSKNLWIYDPTLENPRSKFQTKYLSLKRWHQSLKKAQQTLDDLMSFIEMSYDILDFPSAHENTITMIPCEVPKNHPTLKRGFWVSNVVITFYHWTQIALHLKATQFQNLPAMKTSSAFLSNLPIHSFNWFQVIEFCNALSQLHHLEPFYIIKANQKVEYNRQAEGYRLLHSEEWEYAAYAGQSHPYAGSDQIDETVWYQENSMNHLQVIKQKKANAWDLYDMIGNIMCWCNDDSGLSEQPLSPSEHQNFFNIDHAQQTNDYSFKVCRGAHFKSTKENCQISTAKQDELAKETSQLIGFRIARYFFNH